MPKHLIVLSAPSGGGKTTVTRFLLNKYKNFSFSVSATTRDQRPKEKNDVDYHFLTKNDFQKKIANNEFVEFEEIFGNYYGTLYSDINPILGSDNYLVFDIDVKGALSIRKAFPKDSLLIFLEPPSKDVLIKRLSDRKTETTEQIEKRILRAEWELSKKNEFDHLIVNNVLEETLTKVDAIIQENFKS